MQYVIGFRADGNGKIGMGHLMRCMSVAGACVKAGMKTVFFVADETGARVVREKGFSCYVLGREYGEMDTEAEVLLPLLHRQQVSLLVVDSYYVSRQYMGKLKEEIELLYVDDMAVEYYPVNGILNYNIGGEEIPYKEQYTGGELLLLGSGYAPVREEFAGAGYVLREKAAKILITMGGSDSLNIAGSLAGYLKENGILDKACLEIVCGAFSPHLVQLQEMEKQDMRIRVHSNVNTMARLMADCDIAVAAAGSTMYELCAVGIPAVCCYYVENQRRIAEGFAERTRVINAGDYTGNSREVLRTITEALDSLIADKRERVRTAASMRTVSDGMGAPRIAAALKKYLEKR